MPHETELIATMAIGLSAAFIGGVIVTRLRLPAIVGYLVAGVAVGPFTPGFVADAGIARQLAEIGVIFLMFGVGMHFSIGDLLAVRRVAVPGGIGQALVATEEGRIAVGWLVVEDVLTVVALVLLPVLAESLGGSATSGDGIAALVLTLAKMGLFVALMLVGGTRVVPWLLAATERLGSRELFVLAVLAIALGIAYGAAELFGVSVALGAFLAGIVVNGSPLSHRAAEQALPLQDVFAVLFFVSVGMLIDPAFLGRDLGRVAVVAALIVLGKSAAALLIVLALRRPLSAGLLVAAGPSQIGEFSFILAELGRSLGLLSVQGHNLILAGAVVTITLNPLLFGLAGRLGRPRPSRPRDATS